MYTAWQHGAALVLLFLIVAVSTTAASATTSVTSATTMLTTGTAPSVTIALDSFPQGAELVTVDGNLVVTPTVFSWQIGSTHNVSAVSSLSCGPSCRFVFEAWSDGGQQTHTITVPNSSWTYMAVYQQQYLLTIKSTAGGTATPATGWQNAYAKIPILATPNSGFIFISWNGSSFVSWAGAGLGSFNGTSASASITMDGPITETATFAPMTNETTVTTSPSTASNTTTQSKTVQITITSDPASEGIISVDGTSLTTPHTFTWTSGTTHVLYAPQSAPCLKSDGSVNYSCEFDFQNWSAQSIWFVTSSSFIYTVPSSSETVVANYIQLQSPGFTLRVAPATVFLHPGDFAGSTDFRLSLTSLRSWRGSVQFTTSKLPPGLTVSNMPSTYALDTPSVSWNVELNIAAPAQPGSYVIEITAVSGHLIQTVSVTILVPG
ncbi:MAG: hypothetical protein ABSD99_03015 [Candidatus Bathyarchaeia archaeon]